MFLKQLLSFSAIFVVTSIANADQPKTSDRSTAIDFTIGGVGIGSTLEEFHERLPTAVAGHAANAAPMRDDHFVEINNGASQVPTAYFRFVDKAVISIEIHYTPSCVNEISGEKPMIDQFVQRFGKYGENWRDNVLDGGNVYVWKSTTRFVSFTVHNDGSAKLYIRSTDHPQLYPPKTPKTSILGIDPLAPTKNRV